MATPPGIEGIMELCQLIHVGRKINCGSHDYLHAHKGCRRILHPLTLAEVLAYCFHDTKII